MREYTSQWEAVGPTLGSSANAMLEELEESQGTALDASWSLESARHDTTIPTLEEQVQEAWLWFEARIPWTYNELYIAQPASVGVDVSAYTQVAGAITAQVESVEHLEGQGAGQLVRGWDFLNDDSLRTNYTIQGILVGNEVYLANSESRTDIQGIYSLGSDLVGYHACLPEGVEGQPCVVDIQNEILYVEAGR